MYKKKSAIFKKEKTPLAQYSLIKSISSTLSTLLHFTFIIRKFFPDILKRTEGRSTEMELNFGIMLASLYFLAREEMCGTENQMGLGSREAGLWLTQRTI